MEHQYHDKRPRPRALLPREHYARKGGVWKPKKAFPDEVSARNYILQHWRMMDEGYQAYECSVCHKWHVGKKGHADGDGIG